MSLPFINGSVATLMKEVELRWTAGGKAVATLTLLFEKRKKNDTTNEWETIDKLWVRGTAWERMAENCAESLSKLDEVIVSGELSLREYDRKEGGKGQSLEMKISAIGPNLNRFTAKVAKASRGTGDGGFGSAPADDAWSTASAADAAPPF